MIPLPLFAGGGKDPLSSALSSVSFPVSPSCVYSDVPGCAWRVFAVPKKRSAFQELVCRTWARSAVHAMPCKRLYPFTGALYHWATPGTLLGGSGQHCRQELCSTLRECFQIQGDSVPLCAKNSRVVSCHSANESHRWHTLKDVRQFSQCKILV